MCDFIIVSGLKKPIELEKVVKFVKKVKNRQKNAKNSKKKICVFYKKKKICSDLFSFLEEDTKSLVERLLVFEKLPNSIQLEQKENSKAKMKSPMTF
jgi:hypothetical protein